MINELHDALLHSEVPALLDAKIAALGAMKDYVRQHFAAEEAYMKRINYPGLAAHRRIHDEFYPRVIDLSRDVKDGR